MLGAAEREGALEETRKGILNRRLGLEERRERATGWRSRLRDKSRNGPRPSRVDCRPLPVAMAVGEHLEQRGGGFCKLASGPVE